MEVLQKRDYIKPLLEYIQVSCSTDNVPRERMGSAVEAG
jgi:hypothetical protein